MITIKAAKHFDHSGLRSFSTIGRFPTMIEHSETGAIVMLVGYDELDKDTVKGVLLCYGDEPGTFVIDIGEELFIDPVQMEIAWRPYEGSLLLTSPIKP